MKVLVINAGSSSIKYQLFDMATERVMAKGLVERIGEGAGRVLEEINGRKFERRKAVANHSEAFKEIVADLLSPEHGVIKSIDEIDAVGHRVVHGAEKFSDSVVIDGSVLAAIRECVPLAPLHNPPNLTGIEAAQQHLPRVPHVAVFDTAFHQTMPQTAFVYAVPYELYERDRIRRYGFHGTSHRFVSERAADILGLPRDRFTGITCHLGNGCSATAVKDGRSVDTSLGMTPLEGLVMGTRSGDIDPAIIFHLAGVKGMSLQAINDMLNKKSGLLGLSGVSNDMRSVAQAANQGNRRAQLALQVFAYRVKKYIGSFLAALGGAQAVVFTGGIGENDFRTRARICEGLEALGIRLDPAKNEAACGREGDISTPDSPVRVLVIPTNEELVIARDTAALARKK